MAEPLEVDDAIVLLLGAPSDRETLRDRIEGITRLEKLLFLLERETDLGDALTEDPAFRPHHFGPFSARAYQAVDVLAAAGLVDDSAAMSETQDDTWEAQEVIGFDSDDPYATRDVALTDLGRRYYGALLEELPVGTEDELTRFKARFASLPLRQLIRYVYEKYPKYTDKSVIKEAVLGSGH